MYIKEDGKIIFKNIEYNTEDFQLLDSLANQRENFALHVDGLTWRRNKNNVFCDFHICKYHYISLQFFL
ncbi:Hypothetical predicted protein [Octopus vulgaris]|uniref:Uncharacterized protein n=1 Tax=Octopus vulgaris TaxID=6645 RepID=A0AA36AP45_OCTVU|nr:Hypothetical predicted protein [Octopus vulgaris]